MILPKYDSYLSFFVNASNWVVDLISPMTDMLILLVVYSMCSNLLQHHNSKLSFVLFLAFLITQNSLPYNNTGKTKALTILHLFVIVISLSVLYRV